MAFQRLILLILLSLGTGAMAPCAAIADEPADPAQIVIELDEQDRYDAAALARQFNKELGAGYALEPLEGKRQKLLPAEKAALRLTARFSDALSLKRTERKWTLTLHRTDRAAPLRDLTRRLVPAAELTSDQFRLRLPDGVENHQHLVLLIHGLDSGPGIFKNLTRLLRDEGRAVGHYVYPNDGHPRQSARMLGKRLRALAERRPELAIDVIAHSMGGLLIRRVVEDPDWRPGNINNVLLMAVPHKGSPLASLRVFAEWHEAIGKGKGLGGTLRDGLGGAGPALQPDSTFLQQLNQRSVPDSVDYHQLVGTGGPFTSKQWTQVVERIERRLQSADAWTRARVLGLVRSLDAVQKGKGDGAVSVESANLKAAPKPKRVPLDHVQIPKLTGHEDAPGQHPVYQWITTHLPQPRQVGASQKPTSPKGP